MPGRYDYWGSTRPVGSASSSYSESGDYYTPQQQSLLDQLYPQIMRMLGDASRPAGGAQGFSSLLQAVGGTPTVFSPTAVGGTFDYGQPFNFALGGIAGGTAGAYPEITAGPIWNDQRVQERVNLGRAQSEQAVGGQQRELANRMAALGFGSGGPLAQALATNMAAINLAGQTQAENSLRWNAAQGNAQHLLASQQAAVERARSLGDEDIRRRALTSQDDIQRRQMAAADELQRRQLTGVENWQREQFRANEAFRNRQAQDQSDIQRRELALRQYGIDTERTTSQLNAAIQAAMQQTRPLQRQFARSEQSSGQEMAIRSGGGSRGSSFGGGGSRGGLFDGSNLLRA